MISLSTAFQVLGSSTSVFFLALISLERVFAVLYPLRHRVTSIRPYICSIVICWAAVFCMAGIFLLETYYREVGRVYAAVVIHSCLIWVDYLWKLPHDPHSIALCSTWSSGTEPKFNWTKLTTFKDTVYSSCCVTCVLATWFCSIRLKGVLLGMCLSANSVDS